MEDRKYIDKNFLELFWKLADKNSQVRIKSSQRALSLLKRKQSEVTDNASSKDLEYSVERLIKGLSSSRNAARLGFSLLLTQILKHFPSVLIEDVLELINKHLSFTPKLEKRDAVFGQLFAYSSLVRSKRLAGDSRLSFTILALVDLWQGRSYIVSACYEILADLFSQLTAETFQKSVWPQLQNKLTCGWEENCLDSTWLLLLCLRMFPGVIKESYLNKNWGCSDIFSSDNFEALKKFITRVRSSLPALHPICVEFILHCAKSENVKKKWNALVDDNLFEEDVLQKAFLGFEMVKYALQMTTKKKLVKIVLSPKFCAVFVKSFLNPRHEMNAAASHLANFFVQYVKKNDDPNLQMIILKMFLQPPGTLLADQILNKKEFSLLIQNLSSDAVKAYFELLKDVASKVLVGSDEEIEFKHVQKRATIQISSVMVHPATLIDTEWRMHVVKYLFLRSFFHVQKSNENILHCEEAFPSISDEQRQSFTDTFFKAVGSFYHRTEQATPLQNSLIHLSELAEYADLLLASTDTVIPYFPLEQVQESFQKVKSIVHKLKKQSTKDGRVNESAAFEALFLELGIFMFHDAKTSETLEELYICCKKALSARKHAEENSEEPPWINVVLDILLSLVSMPSNYLRRITTSVFPILCPFFTQDSLQQILNVINPDETDEEPMLVDEPDDEDVEFESGSSDESEIMDGETSEFDDKFKQRVKDALGNAADDSDAESIVMSDSEMFKLDDVLSEAFKSRKSTGHKKMRAEDKAMLDFRLRCLDLLTLYFRSGPPLLLAVECIQPLLIALKSTPLNNNQAPFVLKVLSTLQCLTSIKKFQNTDDVDKAKLNGILENIIQNCHKEKDLSVAQKLNQLCVFIVLCLRRLQNKKSSKSSKKILYLESYLSALDTFVTSTSSNMIPQFFTAFMHSCPDLAWNLIEPSAKYAFSEKIRMYKKTQCLGIIVEALRFSKEQDITSESWINVGNHLIPQAVEELKKVLDNSSMKPLYCAELLNVIATCNLHITKKANMSLLKKKKEFLGFLNDMPKEKLTKSGRTAWRQLVLSLGGRVGNKGQKIKEKKNSSTHEEIDQPNSDHGSEEIL